MTVSAEALAAAHAAYTPLTLRLYDAVVMGLSNPLLWKCPTDRLRAHFDRHVSGNHLDIGVGTGYFLDHARFPVAAPRIVLMDLSRPALAHAARRLARHRPETVVGNVLAPLPVPGRRFDSASLNYVLHCLPGTMATKVAAFDHIRPLLNPGAVLFGSTLLQGDAPRSVAARWLMAHYNRQGIFSNTGDDFEGLQTALHQRFRHVTLECVGCAALFAVRV